MLHSAAAVGCACAPAGFANSQPGRARDVKWLPEVTEFDAAAMQPDLLQPAAGEAKITTVAEWRKRRKELTRLWRRVLGELPARPKKPPKMKVLARDVVGETVRERVCYETLPGESTEAFLLRPKEVRGAVPGFVVFHSTVPHSIYQPAGVKGAPEKAFGLHLAQQGYVALCPRNFLWPDNDDIDTKTTTAAHQQRYPRATGMARMLWEAQLAVDLISSLPYVDGRHIGSIGHSLGAKEVLYLAAFDERVGVTVSSEGGIGMPFSNWDAPWYLGKQIRNPNFAWRHHELLALAAPRPFLLMGGESADGAKSIPYIVAAQPVYRLYDSRVRLAFYNHRQGHAVPPKALQRAESWLATYV